MIIEAPKKPLVVSDGNNATDYGYRYGRWEQERDVAPVLRGRHLKNHRVANASLVPWETAWADGGSGTHPASRLGLVEDCIFENAGAGYTGPPGTGQFNLAVGLRGTYRRFVGLAAAWNGLWTGGMSSDPRGGCYRSLIEHFRLERQIRGIYIEHDTWGSVFRNYAVEATEVGVVSEWAYYEPERDKIGGSGFNLHDGFVIDLTRAPRGALGFNLQPGVIGDVIQNGYVVSPYPDDAHIELPVRLIEPRAMVEEDYRTALHPNVVRNVIHVDSRPETPQEKRCKPANVTYTDKAIGWSGQ
jgi:hypothetical protein